MKKLLILESDMSVAETLTKEFSALGCAVEAVEDAEMARQKASTQRYDLVIISTTLKKSHGFLAFTFLKRIPTLERVPFVIMYSEGEEDQIVSHQNRPTHAEVYIQKPFEFMDLAACVGDYLGLQLPQERKTQSIEEEEVIVDDAIVVDEQGPEMDAALEQDIERVPPPSLPRDDTDFDAVLAALDTPTEKTIGKEVSNVPLERPATFAAGASAGRGVTPKPTRVDEEETVAATATGLLLGEMQRRLEEFKRENTRLQGEVEALRAEIKKKEREGEKEEKKREEEKKEVELLRKRIENAEMELKSAVADKKRLMDEVSTLEAKVESLEKELSKKGAAAATTRELLDLRDLINKKDKEIVRLKDDNNAKEKEILELKDRSIELERAMADLEEKKGSMEQELEEVREKITKLTREKERLSEELENLKGIHAAEITTVMEKMRKEAEDLKEKALAQQEARFHEEKSAEIGALKAKHEHQLHDLKEQYEAEIFDIRDKFEADLQHLKEKAEAEKKVAFAQLRQELEAKMEELRTEIKEKDQINKALMKEAASQEKQIENMKEENSRLREEIESMKVAISDLENKKASLDKDLGAIRSEIDRLKVALASESEARRNAEERVKKITAAAEALIGTLQESRS